MCGRYVTEEDKSVVMAELYASIGERYPDLTLKRGEIFPTDTVPLLGGEDGRLIALPGIWGFPAGREPRLLINARCETVEEKPLFSHSFRTMRCAVPTNGYYEWSQEKIRHRMNLPGKELLYLAGICTVCEEGIRFAILTTEPSPSVSKIHHRMPLILPSGALLPWTCDLEFARRYLRTGMPELSITKLA